MEGIEHIIAMMQQHHQQQQMQMQQQQQQQQQQTAAMIQRMAEQAANQQQSFERALSRLEPRSANTELVDSRGVAKPEPLTSKVAEDVAKFKMWRVKFVNWICAAMPSANSILERIEEDTATDITQNDFDELCEGHEAAPKISAQLRATLVSMCEGEPYAIVLNGPKGARAGIEAMRRLNHRYDPTGPRSSKMLLSQIMNTSRVKIGELVSAVERLEKQFEEYRARSGSELPEEIRMVVLEQMLMDPIKTHCSLGSEQLDTHAKLRKEVVTYAERIAQENLTIGSGATPMDINQLDTRRFNGYCNYCGAWGHRGAECRQWQPQQQTRRPQQGWTSYSSSSQGSYQQPWSYTGYGKGYGYEPKGKDQSNGKGKSSSPSSDYEKGWTGKGKFKGKTDAAGKGKGYGPKGKAGKKGKSFIYEMDSAGQGSNHGSQSAEGDSNRGWHDDGATANPWTIDEHTGTRAMAGAIRSNGRSPGVWHLCPRRR